MVRLKRLVERGGEMGRPAKYGQVPAPGGVEELLRLAWPLILSNSFWALQIFLDRLLLARAGGDQVGAALATAILFWTPLCLFQNTSNYATTFVAQYSGAGRPQRIGPVVWQSLYFSLLGGAVFLALIPAAGTLTAWAGHESHLQELEGPYLRCLCLAAPPLLISSSALSFFAGRGDSRTVLLVNTVGLAVNAVFAWTLIYGYFGFPRLGIVGAGLATVAGSSTSALLALALLFQRRFGAEFATLAGWRFDPALFARLMRYGLPNGVSIGLETLGFALFTLLVGRMGPVELDATSIAFALNLVAFLPMVGIGQAVEILVGRRLGENDPATAARSTWTALAVALLLTGVGAAAFLFLPGPMAELFRSDDARWEQVRALAPVLLRFVAVYCLFDATNLVFSCALRGAGDTRFVTIVSLTASWLVLVLPTWAACRYGWGLLWAWTFVSAYVILLTLVYYARFQQGAWRSMRVIEPNLAADE
jgi:MATE family multidrug resistance protein